MCVYNGEKHISDAIKSVLNQSYSNLELIIVNDYSNDNSLEIINRFASIDSRIIIINNSKNLGLTKSLNIGIKKCKGDVIARIDHDDLWDLKKLELQKNFLSKNNDVTFLATFFKYIDKDGIEIYTPSHFNFTTYEEVYKKLLEYNPICHSSVMINLKLLKALGGYNESYVYAQDYELWSRIVEVSKIYIVPEILTYHRILNENISINKEKDQRINAFYIKIKLLNRNSLTLSIIKGLVLDIFVIITPKKILNFMRNYKRK